MLKQICAQLFHVIKYSPEITAIKVHWFCTSAVKSRWKEEHTVVLKEMHRTVRFYKSRHYWWLNSGEEHEHSGHKGYASYAQK